MAVPSDWVEQARKDFEQETGEFAMVTFDTAALPNAQVMVVAQAPRASESTKERVLGTCVPVHYVAPESQQNGGEGGLSVARTAVSYFRQYENRTITASEYPDTVKDIQVVRQPAHGRVNYEPIDGQKEVFWRYTPEVGYTGTDRFDIVVQVKGQPVRLVYYMEVTKKNLDSTPGEEFCKRGSRWKISNLTPDKSADNLATWQRASDLSTLLANASQSVAGFQDLAGSAVGTTTGEGANASITLDFTAAGHGWYVDATPLDNTDDYLPTSNPNIWQAKAGSDAAGKMDMLSVLLHEYGHALGLDHSADSGDYMAATLQPGQRRMPSADELTLMSQLVAQLKASTALADGSTPTNPSPTTPNPSLPLGALLIGRLALGRKPEDAEQGSQALFSANPTLQGGNLSTLQDWAKQGSVEIGSLSLGATPGATLSETASTQTRLNQVFMVGPQDRFLSFTLSNLALDDATNGPDDAFEAALLNANTGADLLSPLALSNTDALLNLQAGSNGLAELAAQGVTHVTHADGSRTYLVDLSGVARDADGTVAVNLSFDLIGFGTTAASMGSHVQVSDVRLLGLPETKDDSFSGAEDITLTLNALANDTDAVQSGFAPIVLAGPAHGTISVNADGSFSYTADANYFGADSFTYQISNGSLASNTAIVSLTITPVNDAPVAADVTVSTAEDTPVAIQLIASDVDSTGASLQFTLQTQPQHGSLTQSAIRA